MCDGGGHESWQNARHGGEDSSTACGVLLVRLTRLKAKRDGSSPVLHVALAEEER
eukprot:CAMPEP_0194065600 /NCGR_PEP_ID=MMETSP0009_2-20130614/85554_1 /TAXON_ID=210454 /ORGANISM="Grammatophora oceanica, Strain CCMP 410" /LENGTH=54 /DNA_ID=CAMNT_0038718463 /DNA_START=1054 /DNA_END=1218 /DNA_ORIENTATION=-